MQVVPWPLGKREKPRFQVAAAYSAAQRPRLNFAGWRARSATKDRCWRLVPREPHDCSVLRRRSFPRRRRPGQASAVQLRSTDADSALRS